MDRKGKSRVFVVLSVLLLFFGLFFGGLIGDVFGLSFYTTNETTTYNWTNGTFYQTNTTDGGGNLTLGVATNYTIENALMFNDDDSAYLKKNDFGTGDGGGKILTMSFWYKRGNPTGSPYILTGTNNDGNNQDSVYFSSDAIRIEGYTGGGADYLYTNSPVWRDPTGWMHIVIAYDTTDATSTNRIKLYVDGKQMDLAESNAIEQNRVIRIMNTTTTTYFGAWYTPSNYVDGYFAEIIGVDNQQLTATSFGQNDTATGHWIPKEYTGTYGTNGFYLNFANATNISKDVSGNNNHFQNNSINEDDQVTDTPTNNYMTLNPTVETMDIVLSNGNLVTAHPAASGGNAVQATTGVSTGKWYWETKIVAVSAHSDYYGITWLDAPGSVRPTDMEAVLNGDSAYGWQSNNGDLERLGVGDSEWGNTYTTGDILMVALDLDNGKFWLGKNGVWENSGDPAAGTNEAASGLNGTWVPAFSMNEQNVAISSWNFGNPQFAITSGNTDDNGYGNFEYDVPAGFLALNTKNLAYPVKKPSKGIYVNNRTGTGAAVDITDVGFDVSKGALVIIKNRGQEDEWKVVDTVRGATKELNFDSANAESTDANGVTGFLSNGFSLGTGANGYNDNGEGFLNIVLREGATYGFDIVNFTGTGSAHAENHGLGVTPSMYIVKARDDTVTTDSWRTYHSLVASDPETDYANLDTNVAFSDADTLWNDVAPTSTQFTVGTHASVNEDGSEMIAYLFADIPGYQKAFSYTGNGNADGPYIPLGFKPAFYFVKQVDTARAWPLVYSVDNSYNPVGTMLQLHLPNVAGTTYYADILSQGLKIRNTLNAMNIDTKVYVGFAWADLTNKPEIMNYYETGNYTSQIFNATLATSWDNMSWGNYTVANSSLVTNISMQTRTSDDGSSWTEWSSDNHTNPSNLINSSTQYLQYRAILTTDDTSQTPVLEWVNASYSLNFVVTLNIPAENAALTNLTVTFNCSIANGDALNVTLYLDGALNDTDDSGTDDTHYAWPKNLSSSGAHTWTCESCTSSVCVKPAAIDFTIGLNITGTVKDRSSIAISDAVVFVINQSDNSLAGNTTSNAAGSWSFGPVLAGNYTIVGYDPTDATLDADAEPHVVVP